MKDPASQTCSVPRYYDSIDFPELWREFPPAPDYMNTTFLIPADSLRVLQDQRFQKQMQRAWQIPFYQRHWGKAGMLPGDIKGLRDLERIPPFSVHDLRDAIERQPPWGDLIALEGSAAAIPLVLQTSGGTTGLPRPMLYSPRDREVMNIITGRRLFMQGVRPGDVVQVALSLGLANGGFLAREGIWKYSGAIPVMTGTGAQTPTRRQIEIMRAWKTTHLIGFPSYLRHVGLVIRDEMKIEPRELGVRGLIVHLGVDDREALQSLWGASVFDTYGTNECGSLAAECAERSGMHIFEDAFVLEIIDLDNNRPVAAGEKGTIYQTTLFKHLAPLIRFNSNDISSIHPGQCACGSCHQRLSRIFGRSDNMVKFKGTNIFPEAIGALLTEFSQSNGEYVCIVDTNEKGELGMVVEAEASIEGSNMTALRGAIESRLKEALGVTLPVLIRKPGELSTRTGLDQNSKVRRLIDHRVQS